MILVDTSVWIEFFRASGSPVHLVLRGLIDGGADLCVTEPVLMEALAGARTDQEAARIRGRLLALGFLAVRGLDDYEAAASVHRACRRAGETPRSQIDCLIAAVAIRNDASLLQADIDFEVIARHTPLRLKPLSN
ncbi:MAG: PIN domain nuclease [Actinomycetota bacterium]